MLEVHLRHLQHISAIGQEHIPALAVFGDVLVFALLEGFQLRRIIALNPAGLIQTERLPTALRTVFVLQTILDDLELQLPHRTDNLTPVELVDEQLRHTFVHQLVDTLGKLFLLHRVGILNVLEHLRREARKSLEVERLASVSVSPILNVPLSGRPRTSAQALSTVVLRCAMNCVGDEKRIVLP